MWNAEHEYRKEKKGGFGISPEVDENIGLPAIVEGVGQ